MSINLRKQGNDVYEDSCKIITSCNFEAEVINNLLTNPTFVETVRGRTGPTGNTGFTGSTGNTGPSKTITR